jgi:hypothetical protein
MLTSVQPLVVGKPECIGILLVKAKGIGLRTEALVEGAIVFESPERLECVISEAIEETSLTVAPGFGSSDCNCISHLHLLRIERPF